MSILSKFKKIYIVYIIIIIVSSCFLVNHFRKNITVHVTGKSGIAGRLHYPVLQEFPNISTKFIRIDEDINNEYQTKNKNTWLFLGTPVYKQFQHLTRACCEYNKILCEKPVCLSLSEISELKEIINKNKVFFRVNYALRFSPKVQEILDFIEKNNIKSVSIICNSNFNIKPSPIDWKNDYKLGGGILYSIFPHFVDLIYFLNFNPDINSVSFDSSTDIPMNNINFRCTDKTSNCKIYININLQENFDELVVEFETTDEIKIFDLVNVPEKIIKNNTYDNGALSATSEISPWRISFRNLLKVLFSDPNNKNIANIQDAENVHKIINKILNK